MAVSLTLFKKIARIDWNQDDEELQLYLDGAVEFMEQKTNVSMRPKSISYVSDGCAREIYDFPILSVTGYDKMYNGVLSTVIYSKSGDTVNISLGDANNKMLEAVTYSVALTMYEQKEIDGVVLPNDVEIKVNRFIRDSFIS